MSITFTCACGKKMRARDELAGRAVKCPACGALSTVPTLAGPEAGFEVEAADDPTRPEAMASQPPLPSPTAPLEPSASWPVVAGEPGRAAGAGEPAVSFPWLEGAATAPPPASPRPTAPPPPAAPGLDFSWLSTDPPVMPPAPTPAPAPAPPPAASPPVVAPAPPPAAPRAAEAPRRAAPPTAEPPAPPARPRPAREEPRARVAPVVAPAPPFVATTPEPRPPVSTPSPAPTAPAPPAEGRFVPPPAAAAPPPSTPAGTYGLAPVIPPVVTAPPGAPSAAPAPAAVRVPTAAQATPAAPPADEPPRAMREPWYVGVVEAAARFILVANAACLVAVPAFLLVGGVVALVRAGDPRALFSLRTAGIPVAATLIGLLVGFAAGSLLWAAPMLVLLETSRRVRVLGRRLETLERPR